MKYCLLVAALMSLPAAHAENKSEWTGKNKPLKDATYLVYAGEPGDRGPPTKSDRKLAIAIKGKAAQEIFDGLGGPDADVSCSLQDGERLRSRGEVWCSYTPREGYICSLGFNLKTGEPHAGASC